MKYLAEIRNNKLKKFELGGLGLTNTPTFKTNTPKLLDSKGINFGNQKSIKTNKLGQNGGMANALDIFKAQSFGDGAEASNPLGDAANSVPVVDPITGVIKAVGIIDTMSTSMAKNSDGTFKSKTAEALYTLNPLSTPKSLLEGFTTGNYEAMKRNASFGLWGGESYAEAQVRKAKEEQTKQESTASINTAKLAGQQQEMTGGFAGNSTATMFKKGGVIKKPVFLGKLDNRMVSDNTSVQRPSIQQQDVRLKTPQEVKKANRENFQKRIGVKPTYNVQELIDFGTPEPGIEYVPVEAALLPSTPAIKGLGTVGNFALDMLNPLSGARSLKIKPKELIGSPNVLSVTKNIEKSLPIPQNINALKSWQLKELPGLHLKSTMEGEAISKIVEPKTGLINTEQALAIIGKESGGADKVAIIRQGLGENIPKKMDYNEFRKVVQDQLIPLERQFVTHSSEYGIDRLGYGKYKTVINERGNPILQPLKGKNLEPLENQTLILGNKSKLGRGSSAHGNPDETLGHIHFLRDAETPDVLTVTQIQSDAFQGTHRRMPKGKLTKTNDPIDNDYIDEAGRYFDNATGENITQKQLLDKNHQERYLQELVDYAGKRSDLNKVRIPTSETAAKVQGYKPVTTAEEIIEKYNKLKGTSKWDEIMADTPDADKLRLQKVLEGKIKGDIYDLERTTILKKYSEQPKTIKKLFGVEPKVIKDNKENTWYEFDIPNKFKKGKGEIKAFGLTPAIGIGGASALGAGALQQNQEKKQFKKGGVIKDNKRKFADGGNVANPQYEVEKDEVVQGQDTNLEEQTDLASDMTLAGGETHENGGTLGEGGERVFSNRLLIGKPLYGFLSANKIPVKLTNTYAEVATKLGKLKGKYEPNTTSKDPLKHKTATTMTTRIDGLIEAAFQEQEINKQNDMATKTFAYGGKLKKLFAGGVNPTGNVKPKKTLKNPPLFETDGYNEWNTNDSNDIVDLERKKVNPTSKLDWEKALEYPTVFGGESLTNLTTPVKSDVVKKNDKIKKKTNYDLDGLDSHLMNAAIYLKTLNLIDSQEKGIKRKTATPLLQRNVNFLSSANNEIDKTVDTANKTMARNTSSYQDQYSRNADLVSRGIEGKNKAAQAQAAMDMQTANTNNNIINDYNNRNAENINADAIDRVINKNAIIANKTNALNTFLQGVMGHEAIKRKQNVDKEKLAISRMYAGNRGTNEYINSKIKDAYKKGEITKEAVEELTGEEFKRGGVLPRKMKSYC